MRKALVLTVALGLFGGLILVPATASLGDVVTCPTVAPPALSFDQPQFIDTARAGGEPVSVVAPDGSINVSAHAGTTHIYKNPDAAPGAPDFLVGYSNQVLNWRSSDGGQTWKFIGIAGQSFGPHTATSTGFSDPDFAIDTGGRIYNTEIDLANVAVFSSGDDGQSYPRGEAEVFSGDRPWLVALKKDEVFLRIQNIVPSFWRSEDGGLTWTQLPDPPIDGDPIPDPLNRDHGIIGAEGTGTGSFAVSADDGETWTDHQFGPLGPSTQFFGTVAADSAGNVYQAAAGGYNGSSDTTPNGQVTFSYYDRATGETNPDVVTIPTPSGDALWPWVVAGDDGRVAVVWYQSLAGKPNEFYVYAAYTENGHGTTVTCSDGSTQFVPPQFSVANASGTPVHVGKICLQGTTCNANTDFEGGDRRLGDFFTVNFTHDGTLFIVSGDTRLTSLTGSPKPVGNPIFIKQSGGDKMLTTPIPDQPTTPLCPLPTC